MDKMKPRYIWVLTTGDNLELPRAVADSAGELSRMTGVTEDNIRKVSSSGGAFTLIANYILELGGYVCGAVFTENFQKSRKSQSWR